MLEYRRLERLAKYKYSSLLGQFIIYEDNEVKSLSLKKFEVKFLFSFCKLNHFVTVNIILIALKWSKLPKMSLYTTKSFIRLIARDCPLQFFTRPLINKLTYLVTTVSYGCKMFIALGFLDLSRKKRLDIFKSSLNHG